MNTLTLTLVDQVRSYINNQLREKIPIIQIAHQFREPVLPQQFAKFNESNVRRMAQLIVSELIRNTHTTTKRDKHQRNVQIGRGDIDESLFGFNLA
jgi:hypothetical protein